MSFRVGILGGGNISGTHARAAREIDGVEVVAVWGRNDAKARQIGEEVGAETYRELDAFLRHPMDAVLIGSPPGVHGEHAMAAADRGLHVLVEKPLEISTERVDRLTEHCERRGVKLGVFLQDRTAPEIAWLKRLVESGGLGRPLLVSARVRWYRPPEYYSTSRWRGTWALDGGGALMNQGVHLVDLLLWYMGEVEEVFARFDTLAHEIEVEDCLAATLRFANGALGSIVATTAAAPGFPHRVEVYGTQGGVQIEGEAVVRWDQAGEGGAAESRRPATAATPQAAGAGASPTGISAVGHTRLVTDLVEAVRTGRAPLVPGEEGRRSLATVLAVYESARTGRPARPG